MCAGELLRLAGCSSGRGDCARGGLVCGAKQVCCGVFRSDHDRRAFLLECLAFDHACCLPHSAKQDGLRYVAFLFRRGSRSPVARSRIVNMVIGLGRFTSDMSVFWRRSRRRTKETERRGERSRRHGVSAFLRERIGFVGFSAGSTLGLRAPDCAKESSTLWTLFI